MRNEKLTTEELEQINSVRNEASQIFLNWEESH